MKLKRLVHFSLAVTTAAVVGAGCTPAPRNQAADQAELRQPAPAVQPTEPPYVPPEAAQVPRPY